jgi:CubicO group peptidase (beta-lactamase class C family)
MKLKPQNYITLIVLILFIISCSTKTKKQVISNVKKINTISKDSLDKAVNEMMKKYKVPGVSVGIIISGKLDTTFCYGLSQEQTENEVNSNTIFSVGSISKVVNALLILRLVEVGKLDLDTDVN